MASRDQDSLLLNYARSLVILAKEYFRLSKKTRHTFEEFCILLQQSIDRNMDMEHLISGLSFLFDGHDQYVTNVRVFLQEYHNKIPETNTEEQSRSSGSKSVKGEEDTNISAQKRRRSKSTSVVCEEAETSTKKRPRSRSEEEKEKDPFNKKVRSCLGFIDQVRLNLQDEVKYRYFLDKIMRFQEHGNVDRVKKDVLPLFTEHLALELEFSRYVYSAIESRSNGKKQNKMEFVAGPENHSKGGYKVRKPSAFQQRVFDTEEEMFDSDRYYHSMISAKTAAEWLVMENLRKNPKETINIGEYFNVLNFIFLKRDLRGRKYVLDKDKIMLRGIAVAKSKEIVSDLMEKLEELKETRLHKKDRWRKTLDDNQYYERQALKRRIRNMTRG